MIKEPPAPVAINISPEKVCYVIVKAREFDAKVEPVESDPGSNPSDDADREILEDYANDPTPQELQEAIIDLNEHEVVNGTPSAQFSPYLTGMPSLGDYLEEGLAELGYSCDETEMAHLWRLSMYDSSVR